MSTWYTFKEEPDFLLVHRFSVEVSVGPASLLGTMAVDLLSAFGVPSGLGISGWFTEVSGLDSEVEVIEYKTTTIFGERVTQKIPGPPTWGEVTLKKGVTDDMGFWIWHEMIQKGVVSLARANVTIQMHDLKGNAKAKWDLDKAWPKKVSGPSLNAGNNEIGVEEIILVHEGLRRVSTEGWAAAISAATDIL
jgi:phage tail-like protein